MSSLSAVSRAALAVVLLVGLAAGPPAPAGAQVPGDAPFAGAQRGGIVVDAAWLQGQLDAQDLVVLHVGSEYEAGHVPGSRPVPWDAIAESRGERGDADWVRLDIPADVTPVRAAFEELGVSDDSRIVVVFEGANAPPATRVIWTLEMLGLGPRTALLDGGLEAWRSAGGEVATGPAPAVAAGRITAAPRLDRRTWLGEVRGLAGSARSGVGAGTVLLDARRPASWDGTREELPGRTGHIPGARSLPAIELFDEAGFLRPEGELRDLFAEAGIEAGDSVVAYCHIGLWASSVVFAARTLGIDARLYDGSMTEWASDPELPLEVPGAGGANRTPAP